MCRKIVEKMIHISQYGSGDLLLERHMKAINVKNLPQNLKSAIETLKLAAAQNNVVSLSANQIQLEYRMFAILNTALIRPGKWVNYDFLKPSDYRVIINPILISESPLRLKDFEECPSLPGLRFHIWNPISQKYKFHTPKVVNDMLIIKEVTQELKGFQSRIWDHQVRHLQGILALERSISHGQISVGQEYQDNSALHELAQNIRQEQQLTSATTLKKMMKMKSDQDKKAHEMAPDSVPDKITKEMKGRMSKNYKFVKKMLEEQNKKNID